VLAPEAALQPTSRSFEECCHAIPTERRLSHSRRHLRRLSGGRGAAAGDGAVPAVSLKLVHLIYGATVESVFQVLHGERFFGDCSSCQVFGVAAREGMAVKKPTATFWRSNHAGTLVRYLGCVVAAVHRRYAADATGLLSLSVLVAEG